MMPIMARKRVILIDGTAIVFRAFFAIPSSFSTSDGIPTNATYGFALMYRKLLQGRAPDLGAVIFDAPGKTFRDERFKDYKAQRPPMRSEMRVQFPWIHKIVEAHDFPLLSVSGYEADDVIGTLTREALEAGHEVFIVSGDKDFAQLIGEHVRMVDTVKDVTYDAELVRKKWGVAPELFVDYLALVGDSSDNIPGVKGIGPKSAKTLLERFGTLEGVLANTAELKGKQKENLETYADNARLSQELATIDQHVPLDVGIEDLLIPPVDTKKVDDLYRELEFFSLLSGDDAAAHADAADIRAFADLAEAEAFVEEAQKTHALLTFLPAFDGSPILGTWLGAALATPGEEGEVGRYLPIAGVGGLGDAAREFLLKVCADESVRKVAHDVRDLHCFVERSGGSLAGVVGDTRLASFLIDPARDMPHRLDQLTRTWLHRTLPSLKELKGSGKSEVPLAECALEDVARHFANLAATVAELWPPIAEALSEEEQGTCMRDVSLPMASVLARMQVAGVRVDAEVLKRLGAEFEARKSVVEAEVYAAAGREFNIGSTKQLGQVLFDELGLPVIKKTKTGYSTAADVLERLAPKHPIANLVLQRRSLAKLINTYTRVLDEAIAEDGRVHCTFQQTAGLSGRLITTNPDIQRTPIRTGDGKRIREAFLPRDGWQMLSADWSQVELRILAHISGDAVLTESYQTGADIHRRTAAELFGVSPGDVTSEQRNAGKTVNFATIYGQGANALGQSLGITRAEAKSYIERYFELYSGVKDWLEDTVAKAHETGFVETILGRRRYIQELSSNNFSDRAYGERIATNTPIQGSGADICKLAMLNIDKTIRERRMQARMLLQIHDELVFEAPNEEIEALRELVKEAMENAVELRVPLVVDIGTGASWAAAH